MNRLTILLGMNSHQLLAAMCLPEFLDHHFAPFPETGHSFVRDAFGIIHGDDGIPLHESDVGTEVRYLIVKKLPDAPVVMCTQSHIAFLTVMLHIAQKTIDSSQVEVRWYDANPKGSSPYDTVELNVDGSPKYWPIGMFDCQSLLADILKARRSWNQRY